MRQKTRPHRGKTLKRSRKKTGGKRDDRYPPYWNQLSDFTIGITLGQCSRCWWRRAKLTHHLFYPWYWLQIPILCLVPVCSHCHGVVHRHINWVEHADKHFSHNTLEAALSLQIRMLTMLLLIGGALLYLIW